MKIAAPIISVVDDDSAVRKALERLLRAAGLNVACHSSAQSFLDTFDPTISGCVVLDLEMPGLSGLDLQDLLRAEGLPPKIVFLTGRAEVPDGVRAMKFGAVEFLTKPVNDRTLLDAIHTALELDRTDRSRQASLGEIRRRMGTLTPREMDVFTHVIAGKLNKQIAGSLGTVEKTVKVHRARVMGKMQADSLAQLVRFAVSLGMTPAFEFLPATDTK